MEAADNEPNTNQEAAPEPQLSFGDKAVGRSFNPSGSLEVETLKKEFAMIIDELADLHSRLKTPTDFHNELFNTAIQQIVLAQMSAVKAVTYKD